MKKILVVFGTRPEAIKMAPVVMQLKQNSKYFDTKVCVTAQHREMLDQVMDFFHIKSDYDLNLMTPGQSLFDLSAKILNSMQKILEHEKPDLVLVHGDTTTSSLSALSAFYFQIPVGHVEAGLRTYNKYSPWPEEINRQLTARIAEFHFAPTETARTNLINEKIADTNIFITGNTVVDALHFAVQKISKNSQSQKTIVNTLQKTGITEIDELINEKKIILITGHRRENFGEGFKNICLALKEIAEKHNDIHLIYPVHLNPNVQKPVYEILYQIPNISLIEPIDYPSFVFLLSKCYLVLTDSGGIQEEAPSLGKPVLVMRNTTERPEAVEAGTVKLVGTDKATIVSQTQKLLTNNSVYEQMAKAINPYGDGYAAQRIVNIIKNYYNM